MSKSVTINLQVEVQRAVEWLLQRIDANDWYGKSYFSATDVVARVRAAAGERLTGHEPYSCGTFDPAGVVIRGTRFGLLQDVRSALARVRSIESYQPSGKGTCTGLRFRKAGTGLTEAEEATRAARIAAKERGPIRHFAHKVSEFIYAKPLCEANKVVKPSSFRYVAKKFVAKTNEVGKVTCKRCLAALAKKVEMPSSTPAGVLHDKILDTATAV